MFQNSLREIKMDERFRKFEELAIKRWQEQECGNIKASNKYYNDLVLIARELNNEGKLEQLEVLLESSEEKVLLEVGGKLLRINNKKAIIIMQTLAEKKGEIAFCAKMTLNAWENGELGLDKL